EDISGLLRVQLRVHRDRGEAAPPCGIEQLDVERGVRHEQRDPIPALQAKLGTHSSGQCRYALRQLCVIEDDPPTMRDRWILRVSGGGRRKPMTNVHDRAAALAYAVLGAVVLAEHTAGLCIEAAIVRRRPLRCGLLPSLGFAFTHARIRSESPKCTTRAPATAPTLRPLGLRSEPATTNPALRAPALRSQS